MSQVDYDIVKRIARARLAVCLVLQLVMFSAADAAETSVVPIGERSREEIVSFFTENEFGRRPADAERPLLDLRFERTDDDAPLLGGTVMRRRSRVVYAGPYATNSFPVTVFIPTDVKEPAPAFLLVCQRREGFDDCLGDADDYFPVGEIVRRGFAAAVFRTWDVAPDFNTGNTQGVFTAFERPGPYRDNRLWGTLSAWAWGASRALDLIETMPDVDASKVAVVGHSRGGKAALWAAVTDTRFAMACVNGSGCAGAKLNHIDLPKSEHIAQIARTFPYWFCSDYILWANREKSFFRALHSDFSRSALAAKTSGQGPMASAWRQSSLAPHGQMLPASRTTATTGGMTLGLSTGMPTFLTLKGSGSADGRLSPSAIPLLSTRCRKSSRS